jgi:hypothetical protein
MTSPSILTLSFTIRDEYNNKIIDIVHKPSEDILADIFTKSLPPVTHKKLVKSLNMQM